MDNNDKVNPEELAKALESIFGNMLESDKKETKNLSYSLSSRIPPLLQVGDECFLVKLSITNVSYFCLTL